MIIILQVSNKHAKVETKISYVMNDSNNHKLIILITNDVLSIYIKYKNKIIKQQLSNMPDCQMLNKSIDH